MTITAFDAPIVSRVADTLSGTPQNTNPELGPSAFGYGTMLLDPRYLYTYVPGQDFGKQVSGWVSQYCIAVDQIPATTTTNNIATAQTATSGTALTLVSSNTTGVTVSTTIKRGDTGATVTGLLALDSAMTSVAFGQAATIRPWDPTTAVARNIVITSNGTDQTGTFTISGFDIYGFPMTETLTGTNATTSVGSKAFKYIRSVTPGGTVASTGLIVGTGDKFGFPLRVDRSPYVSVFWGGTQVELGGGNTTASSQVVIEPVILGSLTSTAVIQATMPFNGVVRSVGYRSVLPATNSTGAATLSLAIAGTTAGVSGGVITLTQANSSASGVIVAGTATTATFVAGQTVGVMASNVTAFVTGSGWIELSLLNSDVGGGTFTAAVTTAATSTSGDVRGTFAVPTASNGTSRLTMFIAIPVANLSNTTGLLGPPQA